nr:MAG TPA: hypothetical protein [Caudoviricetes sp.]
MTIRVLHMWFKSTRFCNRNGVSATRVNFKSKALG